ncbi:MAG: hypothetical protein AB8G95_17170, partial [Anaerolineae bacterium]
MAIVGQCADLTGNLGLQGSGSVNIDKTAPVANPTFNPASNAAGWYNADVTITWNWSDPASANGTPLSGLDPDNCELTSTLAGEGPLAIVGQCPDLAGNLGLQGSGSVSIDKSAPNTTITASPPAVSPSSDASFTFSGADAPTGAPSGVASFECQLDGGGFSACESPINFGGIPLGEHTFEVRAVDLADNIDPTPASYIWTVTPDGPVDTTAPTANPTLDPAANTAGWHNIDVTITWNWTDEPDGSGIDPDNCTLTSIVTNEGSSGAAASCADLAGNSGSTGIGVNIDKTAGETTITTNPPATSTTGDASFTFSGTDAISGIASFECLLDDGTIGIGAPCTSPQNYTGLASGTYTFSVNAIDVAGNIDLTPATFTWTVETPDPDTTAPTASPTFDPAPNERGWFTSDVTVTFNWTDNPGGSGVNPDACNLTTVVTAQGSNVGYGGGCSDLAGNVGE